MGTHIEQIRQWLADPTPWAIRGQRALRSLRCLLDAGLACVAIVFATGAQADFDIAYTGNIEESPATVYNSVADEYLVAWMASLNGIKTVQVQRLDSETGAKLGPAQSVLEPSVIPYLVSGRPALAYSPVMDAYVIAVNARIGGNEYDDLLLVGSFDGTTLQQTGGHPLFVGSQFHDPTGVGAIDLTYDRIREEFLVSYQRSVLNPSSGAKHNTIWTQRYAVQVGAVSEEQLVVDYGQSSIASHDVARSEYITSWLPPAPPVMDSIYLIAHGGGSITEIGLATLDGSGAYWRSVPFVSGVGGASQHPAIATGRVEGMSHDQWLVVWQDFNNRCSVGQHFFVESCLEPGGAWTGIWGSYIDPWRTSYGSGADNAVLPISMIGRHVMSERPDVVFDDTADAFYVAWRELPVEDIWNDESRSHIRANTIDYFVASEPAPVPPANLVVSTPEGVCPPAPEECESSEAPNLPAVAATGTGSVLTVWNQEYPPNRIDLDIFGEITPVPEPSMALLLSAGVGALVTLSPRRRREERSRA